MALVAYDIARTIANPTGNFIGMKVESSSGPFSFWEYQDAQPVSEIFSYTPPADGGLYDQNGGFRAIYGSATLTQNSVCFLRRRSFPHQTFVEIVDPYEGTVDRATIPASASFYNALWADDSKISVCTRTFISGPDPVDLYTMDHDGSNLGIANSMDFLTGFWPSGNYRGCLWTLNNVHVFKQPFSTNPSIVGIDIMHRGGGGNTNGNGRTSLFPSMKSPGMLQFGHIGEVAYFIETADSVSGLKYGSITGSGNAIDLGTEDYYFPDPASSMTAGFISEEKDDFFLGSVSDPVDAGSRANGLTYFPRTQTVGLPETLFEDPFAFDYPTLFQPKWS